MGSTSAITLAGVTRIVPTIDLLTIKAPITIGAAATLGGTGIIGGNVTIADGGKLEFDFSTPAGGHDKLELAAGKALAFSGASTLTITSAMGATTGLYTLITVPGGSGANITGAVPATVILPAGWTAATPVIFDDLGNTSLQIKITSNGGAPEIDVNQGGDIPSGGSKGFGTVTIGSPTSLVFTINNTGTADLNLTNSPAVIVSGANASEFTVTAPPATPVTAGNTITFTVQSAPSGSGVRNALLTIANNDRDEGTFTINVSGTGQTPYEAWCLHPRLPPSLCPRSAKAVVT